MDATKQVTVAGQEVRLLDAGDGHPVVVLHGWGGRIESMAPVLDCLGPHFRVIALDLPGFGSSPAPCGAWGTDDYARLVRSLLAELDIPKAHFVGHSYGAKTSLLLAATHPGVVDKVIAVGASGLRIPPSLSARARRTISRIARFSGRLGAPGRALRSLLYDKVASEDYKQAGAMRPTLVKVVNEDLSDLLPSIQAPTLLVWGSEDDAAPLRYGKTMERLIPDAGLVVFEGAGHFAYLDEPGRFCVIVRRFLDIEG